jgi:hypothetical protein
MAASGEGRKRRPEKTVGKDSVSLDILPWRYIMLSFAADAQRQNSRKCLFCMFFNKRRLIGVGFWSGEREPRAARRLTVVLGVGREAEGGTLGFFGGFLKTDGELMKRSLEADREEIETRTM